MKRHWLGCLLVAIVTVASEQGSCAAPMLALPSTAVDWALAAPQSCATPEPAQLRAWRGISRARQICRAEYRGSPDMKLTLYNLPGGPGGTAFDALQQWRTQPAKMAFYKGRYFGVVESPAGMNALNRFVIAVEASLPNGGEARR